MLILTVGFVTLFAVSYFKYCREGKCENETLLYAIEVLAYITFVIFAFWTLWTIEDFYQQFYYWKYKRDLEYCKNYLILFGWLGTSIILFIITSYIILHYDNNSVPVNIFNYGAAILWLLNIIFTVIVIVLHFIKKKLPSSVKPENPAPDHWTIVNLDADGHLTSGCITVEQLAANRYTIIDSPLGDLIVRIPNSSD